MPPTGLVPPWILRQKLLLTLTFKAQRNAILDPNLLCQTQLPPTLSAMRFDKFMSVALVTIIEPRASAADGELQSPRCRRHVRDQRTSLWRNLRWATDLRGCAKVNKT